MTLDKLISPAALIGVNAALQPFGAGMASLYSGIARMLAINPLAPRMFAWRASWPGAVDRLIEETGSRIDPRGVALYRRWATDPAHVGATLRMMANWRLDDLEAELPKLPTPLHLLIGSRDRTVPPDRARDIARIVRDDRDGNIARARASCTRRATAAHRRSHRRDRAAPGAPAGGDIMNAHARPEPHDARPHAIVIGSGFGGLAAAVRLGARGYRVTVLEKLDAPGGRAYVYKQDGFTFDAGPTIITAPYLFEELWSVAGARMADDIDLRVMDPFYLIRFDDGTTIRCVADLDGMREEVARIEPRDLPGFDRFLKDSAAIYEVAFKELADKPFHELKSLVLAAPDLVRLGGFRSVYSKVCQYFENEKLRVAFSFHPLLIGGNPFSTTAYYCLISHLERMHGVHFAMGGTGAIVNALARLASRVGATFRYEAEVERINVEEGRATGVTLKGGETIASDIVVSNADAAFTYSKLLSHVKRRRWTNAKLARARYSMSLFVWYFGTNRKFEDVYHHMMVLGPRYQGLLQDIFERKHLADDFSLYLHRPTMTDPSLAPEGCDAFYALAPVPHLDSGTDWTHDGRTVPRAHREAS